MSPKIELRSQFFEAAKARMDALAEQRGLTVPDFRCGQTNIVAILPSSFQSAVESLATEEALQALNKLAVNEYWLLYLACTAAANSPCLPFDSFDVANAAKMLQRVYTDRDLVAKVNTGMFGNLTAAELGQARADGIIVYDETWPYADDENRINPVFIAA